MLLAQMVVEYAADVTKLTTGVTAATDAMTTVGAAAAESSGYLATLGDQAFTTGVGFDGMAASADVASSSFADMYGVVDTSALSLEQLNTYLYESNREFGLYVDGSSIAADTTNTLSASMERLAGATGTVDTTLAGTSLAAGDAAVSFDALSIAEGAAATAGDAIEASLAAVGTALAVVGIGAGIAGVVSTKMAGDFESSMTSLVTGAGEAQSNIKMVSDGILNMAPAVGTSTKDLASGMYMIESAGFRGADALNVLKDAAEGAKVGNSDLSTTAQAVTGAMINYKDSNLTAAQATNDLIATVGAGQVHLQDLALAMANVEPIAAKSGVSLTDISAAMATMTAKTIPAADAATYLRQTIMAIENPTTKARDEFKAMGLNSADVAEKMKTSLPDALQMITDAAGKKFPVGSAQYIAAIADMVGGTKSMQGIMNLTGSDMATFKKNVEDISGKVKAGGDNISGWAKVQGDFNFKMEQAKGTLEAFGIQIGQLVLPQLSKLLDAFNSPEFKKFATGVLRDIYLGFKNVGDFVGPLIPKFLDIAKNFGKVTEVFQNPAIQKLATEIGGDLKKGIEWLINALASPQFGEFMKLVGEGIAGAIEFVIPLVIEITKNIVKFAEDVISRVQPQIEGFMKWWNMAWPGIALILQGAWDWIKGIVQIAWAIVSGIIKVGLDIISGNWKQAWEDIKTAVSNVWDGIKTSISGAIEIVKGWFTVGWQTLADTIGKPFTDAWATISGVFDNIRNAIATLTGQGPSLATEAANTMTGIHHFAGGVDNFKGGWALVGEQGPELVQLPTGASVVNAAKTRGLMSYGGGTGSGATSNNQQVVIQNHFYVDGKEVTTKVMTRVQKELRGHGLKK